MTKKACKNSHLNLVSLKAAVEAHWADMFDVSLINSIKRFHGRLEKWVAAEGSVFEKQFSTLLSLSHI